jgi:hypothetical protein
MITSRWIGNETDSSGYAEFTLINGRSIRFDSFHDYHYLIQTIEQAIKNAKQAGREEVLNTVKNYVGSLK